MDRAPILIPESSAPGPEDVLRHVPGDGPVWCVDFYLTGAEWWQPETYGWSDGRVRNVDHHAPDPRFYRAVSSTNLALEVGRVEGTVVINHTDCDSVLAAAILLGLLEPDPKLGAAAIAADHTGAENDLADALQALQHRRDFAESLAAAQAVLARKPLSSDAEEALRGRRAQRAEAQSLAHSRGKLIGTVFWVDAPARIDGELMLPCAGGAELLLLTLRMPEGRTECKIRLLPGASQGFTLFDLRWGELDANFGGRWNAGSNKRGGGTSISAQRYAELLSERVEVL